MALRDLAARVRVHREQVVGAPDRDPQNSFRMDAEAAGL